MLSTTRRRFGPSRGFSLVEVMVAVFVLAVAMLGVAGLQVVSKRSNFESVQRITATHLTQELVERIRANSGQLTVYTNAGAGRTLALQPSDGISATDCVSAACDTATLAMYDLYEFLQALAGVAEVQGGASAGGLVSPTVCLTGPATTPGFVSVAVAWRGMTRMSNPTINACGAGSGRYDDDGDADVMRRILLVETFVE
ncbi:MAG: type IV pilus modification protein PilV [Gammaproteobacteria bacterium]